METFGRSGGGGRRNASRAALPLPAILTTVSHSICAGIVDLSCTGVRLQGAGLPPQGEDCEIKIECVKRFATVMWSGGEQCGIAFERSLTSLEVSRLKRDGKGARMTGLSTDERQALEDWIVGFAR